MKEYVCRGEHYKPATIGIACGDGNAYVTNLHWPLWTARKAVGVGSWRQNNCQPACAAGSFVHYPVRLILTRAIFRRGTLIFGRVVASFPRNAPPYPAYRAGRVLVMSNGRQAP